MVLLLSGQMAAVTVEEGAGVVLEAVEVLRVVEEADEVTTCFCAVATLEVAADEVTAAAVVVVVVVAAPEPVLISLAPRRPELP